MKDADLIDPEKIFGIAGDYWERLEEGRTIQSRALDNYIRTLNVRDMLELMKIRKLKDVARS